ncbi:hypothetical protein Tsubulata_046694 [Turnera subulata]|uniref:DNA-directed RNA polymerase subunit n=1 Tax=Turnera subulata TaxID=218843 RepID=A0A9Q0FHR5_9ROSI|nr:hypothetical protein Tsubulata_046694 [Turnera subulata]
MFLKVQLSWNVVIPAANLEPQGLMLQKSIIIRLLDEFARKKATKDHGYFLAVTTLDKIGEGKIRQHSGDVLFPVVFSCITFKILKGEILEGTADKIMKHGVFLRCGPIENAYLSHAKMPGYQFLPGENPEFLSEKGSKIRKGAVVRVVVMATKWLEAERKFQALVSYGHNISSSFFSLLKSCAVTFVYFIKRFGYPDINEESFYWREYIVEKEEATQYTGVALHKMPICCLAVAMGNELSRVHRPFWWITSSIYAKIGGKVWKLAGPPVMASLEKDI